MKILMEMLSNRYRYYFPTVVSRLQWGSSCLPAFAAETTINYPLEFSHKAFQTFLLIEGTAGVVDLRLYKYNSTKSYAKARVYGASASADLPIIMIAVGF